MGGRLRTVILLGGEPVGGPSVVDWRDFCLGIGFGAGATLRGPKFRLVGQPKRRALEEQ